MKRDEFAHGWKLRHLCAMLTALAVLLLPFSAWGETLEAYARDRFQERHITGGGVVVVNLHPLGAFSEANLHRITAAGRKGTALRHIE